jgi:hypothetical protein
MTNWERMETLAFLRLFMLGDGFRRLPENAENWFKKMWENALNGR